MPRTLSLRQAHELEALPADAKYYEHFKFAYKEAQVFYPYLKRVVIFPEVDQKWHYQKVYKGVYIQFEFKEDAVLSLPSGDFRSLALPAEHFDRIRTSSQSRIPYDSAYDKILQEMSLANVSVTQNLNQKQNRLTDELCVWIDPSGAWGISSPVHQVQFTNAAVLTTKLKNDPGFTGRDVGSVAGKLENTVYSEGSCQIELNFMYAEKEDDSPKYSILFNFDFGHPYSDDLANKAAAFAETIAIVTNSFLVIGTSHHDYY